MVSGYGAKIAASVTIAVVITAVLGTYFAFNFPSQATRTISSGLTVYSNKVVTVRLPGFGYSVGVWQLGLGNPGNSNLFATYQIFVDGNLAYGNSTVLQPDQQSTITSCLVGPITASTSFDVPISPRTHQALLYPTTRSQ